MMPKRLIYCWFGNKEKPISVQNFINKWKEIMPDWEFLEINETNFDINSFAYSKDAYKKEKWAYVSDVARIWALYNYGGVYLDTDIEVFKPFDELLNNKFFIGVEQPHYFGNATIGAEPKNNIVKEILDAYKIEKFEDKENWTDFRTGPMIVTDILEKYVDRDSMEYQKTNDITIYPKKYFVNNDILDDEVYCKHHMLGSWCNK